MYKRYKTRVFPSLLKGPLLNQEDKEKITNLLDKPWNPYIRWHSALTEKSKIQKEDVLRQHAGWTATSYMHQKYIHYFGNESNESILEAYGIIDKNKQEIDRLKPKQCPNCNEQNNIILDFVQNAGWYCHTMNTLKSLNNEEIEQSRYEKLEDRIGDLARHFWKNNVTRGITEQDAIPLTGEEIDYEGKKKRTCLSKTDNEQEIIKRIERVTRDDIPFTIIDRKYLS